jgi:hypothetical protein
MSQAGALSHLAKRERGRLHDTPYGATKLGTAARKARSAVRTHLFCELRRLLPQSAHVALDLRARLQPLRLLPSGPGFGRGRARSSDDGGNAASPPAAFAAPPAPPPDSALPRRPAVPPTRCDRACERKRATRPQGAARPPARAPQRWRRAAGTGAHGAGACGHGRRRGRRTLGGRRSPAWDVRALHWRSAGRRRRRRAHCVGACMMTDARLAGRAGALQRSSRPVAQAGVTDAVTGSDWQSLPAEPVTEAWKVSHLVGVWRKCSLRPDVPHGANRDTARCGGRA